MKETKKICFKCDDGKGHKMKLIAYDDPETPKYLWICPNCQRQIIVKDK